MDFPLRVRPMDGNIHMPAIIDRLGNVVAYPPPGRNLWRWQDDDAKQIVDAANASQSHPNGEVDVT
jgi:hypothetical protein